VLRRGEWGGVDKVGDVWPLPDGLKMKFGKALADCRCRTVRWAMLAVAAKFWSERGRRVKEFQFPRAGGESTDAAGNTKSGFGSNSTATMS
jgi:hypothetical protein